MTEMPRLDPRDLPQLIAQSEALAEAFTPWRRARDGELDGVGALLRVFARIAARTVDALNEAPQVQVEALLELLGMRPRPPRPARVPLVFRLAEGAQADAMVPVRTQVGSRVNDEVVLETEEALTVVRTPLTALRVRDPAADRWGDRDALLLPGADASAPAFTGEAAIERALYLECAPLLSLPGLTRLELALDFAVKLTDPGKLETLPIQLRRWDGAAWAVIAGKPAASLVEGRHRLQWIVESPPPLLPCAVDERLSTWLKVQVDSAAMVGWWRAAGAIAATTTVSVAEALRAVPPLQRALLRVQTRSPALVPDRALQSGRPVDVTRDFYPFDATPRLGAALAIGQGAALSAQPGALVKLALKVAAAPAPAASAALELVWELHTASGWRELGRSAASGVTSSEGAGFVDTTARLCKSGEVSFKLLAAPVPDADDGCWLRVWISAGDYGEPARINYAVQPPAPVPATYAPPLLRPFTISLEYTSDLRRPSAARLAGDFTLTDRSAELQAPATSLPLFAPAPEAGPALYLGLAAPPGPVPLSLHVGVAPLRPADAEQPQDPDPPRVQWEYRGPAGWTALGVRDETAGLTVSGLVRFTAPAELATTTEFGQRLCWVRARWAGGRYRGAPWLTGVRLNAVWARHAVAISGEVLGSGDGAVGQVFTTNLRPVLAGERVWVRERSNASPDEVAALLATLPADDVSVQAADDGAAVWVRWWPVVDLRASGPDDRHYVLRALPGELRFGDGRRGRVLPRGRTNVRIDYECGGGPAGNCDPGTITQLRASLPYIAGVDHDEPATGGAAGEDTPDLATRGPADLRHGGRAVTGQDLEDLAREASVELAQVKAVTPRFDPLEIAVELGALDRGDGPPIAGAPLLLPDGRVKLPQISPEAAAASARAGVVRLLVVARGDEDRPVPSAGLLAQVERHVRARCSPLMRVEVTGPRWVEVAVQCRVVAASYERAEVVCADVRAALRRFLHPLRGGPGGAGWPFGRAPRRSDLGRVIVAVPGVDHVRGLDVSCTPPLPNLEDALGEAQLADLERIMVFSGTHTITLHGVVGEGNL